MLCEWPFQRLSDLQRSGIKRSVRSPHLPWNSRPSLHVYRWEACARSKNGFSIRKFVAVLGFPRKNHTFIHTQSNRKKSQTTATRRETSRSEKHQSDLCKQLRIGVGWDWLLCSDFSLTHRIGQGEDHWPPWGGFGSLDIHHGFHHLLNRSRKKKVPRMKFSKKTIKIKIRVPWTC